MSLSVEIQVVVATEVLVAVRGILRISVALSPSFATPSQE